MLCYTRFHHAIGAMYLMTEALQVLKSKDIKITEEEESRAAIIAILLRDGTRTISHALEHTIVKVFIMKIFLAMLMDELNKAFKGKLSLAIKIFKNDIKNSYINCIYLVS